MARRLTESESASLLDELSRIEQDQAASSLERCHLLDELLRTSYLLATDDELQTFASVASRQVYVHQSLGVPPHLAAELEKLLSWLYRTLRQRIEYPHAQLRPAYALIDRWLRWQHRAESADQAEFPLPDNSITDDQATTLRIIARERSVIHLDSGTEIPVISGTVEASNHSIALQLHRRWRSLASAIRHGTMLGIIAPQWISPDTAACTDTSLVILEPDLLLDVTTVAECFTGSTNTHLRVLLQMLTTDAPSAATVVGTVVNACFDELLADPEVEPSRAIERALRTRYVDVLAAVQHGLLSLEQVEHDVSIHLDVLRRVIPHLRGQATTEPMFIAPRYGVQGRIDVLLEDRSRPASKTIIELKSGAPPTQLQRMASQSGAHITVGMRPNHLMQIAGYNLLLDAAFPGCQGTSQILYSRSAEEPLRNAPNLHEFKADFLAMRNKIVAMYYDLAHRRFRALDMLGTLDVSEASPLDRQKLQQLQQAFGSLDEQEQLYLRAFLAFAFREWITTMVGSPLRNGGYSALWRSAIEEKSEELRSLTFLRFDATASNWERGYLTFRFTERTPPVHPFRAGDIAVLYQHEALVRGGDTIAGQVFKCTVRSLGRDHIVLSLRNKLFDRTLFASEGFWALDPDVLSIGIESMVRACGQFAFACREHRQLLLGNVAPRTQPRTIPRPTRLTDLQYELLCRCLAAQDYFLLEGPPGTGKTSTMLRSMVDYLLADPREVILCTALTNRAVDEICSALEHLWNDGLLLRLGSLDATEHDAISFARSAQTQDFAELASQLQRARVIVATVPYLNANLHLFSLIAPTTAIVDEAAQLLEPHLLALAVRVERMVMIGDVCQLPAVVEQDERGCRVQHPLLEAIGVERLDRSLFERLLRLAKRNHWTHAYGRLIEQARMHHLIARFPGTQFYGTIFRSMHRWQDEAPDVLPIEMLPMLLRHRLVFVDTPRESASGYNRSEAQIAAACTRALVKACHDRSPSQAIGIVTPFRKQIRTIAELLGDLSQQVTIDTVERFQGSERDHIIVSCAVNSRQHLRRIESPTELDGRTIDRKLNVALTRARHQVIIIGNRQLLELSPHYAALVGFIEQHGLVVSAAEAMRALSPFLTSHEIHTHHWH